eukprot:scaffold241814_cov30-Tisochrysis_lutea.AAC.2
MGLRPTGGPTAGQRHTLRGPRLQACQRSHHSDLGRLAGQWSLLSRRHWGSRHRHPLLSTGGMLASAAPLLLLIRTVCARPHKRHISHCDARSLLARPLILIYAHRPAPPYLRFLSRYCLAAIVS